MNKWQKDMEERKIRIRERRVDLKALELEIRREELEYKKSFHALMTEFMERWIEKTAKSAEVLVTEQ